MEKEEREHKEASTKHSRVAALGVNIDHFKKVAVEQHKCQICDRPLNNQELQKFLRFQVSCCCLTHQFIVLAESFLFSLRVKGTPSTKLVGFSR